MLITAMVFVVVLTIIGYKARSFPVIVVSSLGWVVIALYWYQDTQELLHLVLMIMIAFAQVLLVRGSS